MLDAQFFGVAQRRERVFLVVNTRDWRRAAPVLFERESLCWDHTSSREKRQSLTQGTAGGVGDADSDARGLMLDFHQQDGRFKVSDHPDVSNTLTSHMGTGGNNVPLIKAFKWSQGEKSRSLAIGEVSPTLSTDHNPAVYQIERERESDVSRGHSGECRTRIRSFSDIDGSRRKGCPIHLSDN